MDIMNLVAKLTMDSSDYNAKLTSAQSMAMSAGKMVSTALKTWIGIKAVGYLKDFVNKSRATGMQFESAMSQVAATMGTTVDQIQDLRDFAQQMGRTTVFTATQSAEALNYMALAGYDAQKSMAMLPQVLNLASAGNMDLARASDMVTDAESALGLTTKGVETMIDQMAKTASKSNTSVEQLGDALLTIGGTARLMHGNTDELNTVLGILADNGIKGSEAGTHLRNMLLKLSAPTKDGEKWLKALNVQIFDAKGNMRSFSEIFPELNQAMSKLTNEQRTKALSDMFNARDIASANALLNTTVGRWSQLSNAIQGAWYTYDDLIKQMSYGNVTFEDMEKNLKGIGIQGNYIEGMLNASGGSVTKFAESILESSQKGTTMRDVIQALGGDVEAYDKAIEKASEDGLTHEETLNAMEASLGKLQTAFDNTQGAAERMAHTQLGNLKGDVQLLESAVEGFQIAISEKLTPMLSEWKQWGATVISSLTNAFRLGETDFFLMVGEAMRQALVKVSEQIPQWIATAGKFIVALGNGFRLSAPIIAKSVMSLLEMAINTAKQALPQVLSAIPKALTGIANALPNMAGFVLDTIKQFVPIIMSALPDITSAFGDLFLSAMSTLMTSLPQLWQIGIDMVKYIATGITEGVPALLEQALPMLLEFSQSMLDNSKDLVDAGMRIIVNLMQGLMDALPMLIEYVPQIITNIANIVNENMPVILATGIQLIAMLGMGLIQAIPSIISNIGSIIQAIIAVFSAMNWLDIGMNIITAISQGVKAIGRQLPTTISGFAREAINAVKRIDWLGLGKSIIDGIVAGIKALGGNIASSLAGFAQGGVDKLKSLLGIASPSKVFRDEVGKWIPAGIAEGIEDNMKVVDDALAGMKTDVTSGGVSVNTNGLSGGSGGYGNVYQTLNVYSPQQLTPSEIARQTRDANREMVLSLRGV